MALGPASTSSNGHGSSIACVFLSRCCKTRQRDFSILVASTRVASTREASAYSASASAIRSITRRISSAGQL
jgi:hypothetical protein